MWHCTTLLYFPPLVQEKRLNIQTYVTHQYNPPHPLLGLKSLKIQINRTGFQSSSNSAVFFDILILHKPAVEGFPVQLLGMQSWPVLNLIGAMISMGKDEGPIFIIGNPFWFG